jgi:hypothetical protein
MSVLALSIQAQRNNKWTTGPMLPALAGAKERPFTTDGVPEGHLQQTGCQKLCPLFISAVTTTFCSSHAGDLGTRTVDFEQNTLDEVLAGRGFATPQEEIAQGSVCCFSATYMSDLARYACSQRLPPTQNRR